MTIFGVDFYQYFTERRDIWIPTVVVSVATVGLSLTGYSLITRFRRSSEEDKKAQLLGEDLDLPLALEYEYGDFRRTCLEANASASAFLNDIPDRCFNFKRDFLGLITAEVSSRFPRRKRALIIGSSTGFLCFELGKSFAEVKGVENSFTKVITCFKFQNRTRIPYYFPLEGSYRTTTKYLAFDAIRPGRPDQQKASSVEHIQFVNADPCSRLSAQVGLFQVVVIPNTLNELSDPESLLGRIHLFVEDDGLLIISSDYNWKRVTNRHEGFGNAGVQNSFGFLQSMFKDTFDLVQEKNMLDAFPESLRSCKIRNCHVTVWSRKREVPSSN